MVKVTGLKSSKFVYDNFKDHVRRSMFMKYKFKDHEINTVLELTTCDMCDYSLLDLLMFYYD